MVRLRIEINSAFYTCGGTIIGDQWIASAAHCFSFAPTGERIIVTAEIGNWRMNKNDKGEFRVQVQEIIFHPSSLDETGTAEVFDIALLRVPPLSVSKPKQCNNCYEIACLPTGMLPNIV